MSARLLEIEVNTNDATPTMRLSGELDLSTVGELEPRLAALVEAEPGLLSLDLSALRFIDSAGLRCLLTQAAELERRGGRIVIRSPQRAVARVLELTDAGERLGVTADGAGAGS